MRMEERKLDERKLREVALTRDEYRVIVEALKRPPNDIELGMLGVLWSEHCSYKTSKPLLRRLPSSGAAVLQGPGENAGAVSLGNGWAVVFKIESHNHPSAIDPYQGAATGVGGILRDVIAMGGPATSCARVLKAQATSCCSSAPTPVATAYMARRSRRSSSMRTAQNAAPPCRSATRSSKSACSRHAWTFR